MDTDPIRNENWHPEPLFNIEEIDELPDDDRLQYMIYAQAHPEFVAMRDKLKDLYEFPGNRESLTKKEAIEVVQGLILYYEQLKEATDIRVTAFTGNINERQCVEAAKRAIKLYQEEFTSMCTNIMELVEETEGPVFWESIHDCVHGTCRMEDIFVEWLGDSSAF